MAKQTPVMLDLVAEMCSLHDVPFTPAIFAHQIMQEAKILTADHTLAACMNFMEVNRVRHAPVIDPAIHAGDEPFFMGVVSERDVLRVMPSEVEKKKSPKKKNAAMRVLLAKVVTRKPKVVAPDATIMEVIALMADNHIDLVPVLEGKTIKGVITATDVLALLIRLYGTVEKLLLRAKAHKRSAGATDEEYEWIAPFSIFLEGTCGEVMTEMVHSLSPDDQMRTAVEMMQENTIRHVPIVDEKGALVGIVSDRDILRQLPSKKASPSSGGSFRKRLFDTDPTAAELETPLGSIMSGSSVHIKIGTRRYDAARIMNKRKIGSVKIENDVWMGANVTALKGVVVGEGAVSQRWAASLVRYAAAV